MQNIDVEKEIFPIWPPKRFPIESILHIPLSREHLKGTFMIYKKLNVVASLNRSLISKFVLFLYA